MAHFGLREAVMFFAGLLSGGAGGFAVARGTKREPSVESTISSLLDDYYVALDKAWADEDGAVRQYRAAVGIAWADGKLTGAAAERLGALESELGLGQDEAGEIEREVMGGSRTEIVAPDPIENGHGEDLLEDKRWVDLAEECVDVVDELDRTMDRFDPKSQELADHVIWRMAEVLERSGVELISDDTAFDTKRHKPEEATSRTASGTAISETLSPGFAVGRRVLRRARVRVE